MIAEEKRCPMCNGELMWHENINGVSLCWKCKSCQYIEPCHIWVRFAHPAEVVEVVKFIDTHFTKEGYGWVTSAQIKTELKRQAVVIAMDTDTQKIVGVRIGKASVYNLSVHPDYRRHGIGRQLILFYEPDSIRVKCIPTGNLSKTQLKNFVSPEEFYIKCGFTYARNDYPKNFYAGETADGKRIYYTKGKTDHIKIYISDRLVLGNNMLIIPIDEDCEVTTIDGDDAI